MHADQSLHFHISSQRVVVVTPLGNVVLVVVVSPREATDGAIVVDLVAAGSLSLRNVASEGANVEMNYLVISKA